MGNKVSRSYRAFRARKLRRFILVGLDNSGKTTLKEHMLGLNKEGTVPTMEAEHFQVKFGGYTFLVTDLGGQVHLRHFWRHHYTGAQGVIFVVDATDPDRFADAKEELRSIFSDDQLDSVPLVVFANKQDKGNAASKDEVFKAVCPDKEKMRNRAVMVVACSILNGEGVYDGLKWLTQVSDRV